MITLSDVKPDSEGTTNVTAIASYISSPFSLPGGNPVCKIDLIDQDSPLICTCLLYGYSLPDNKKIPINSIISLTSVKVQYFAGRLQINKSKDFTFSFFHPLKENFEPVHTNKQHKGEHHVPDEQKQMITELRNWVKSPNFETSKLQKVTSRENDPVVAKRTLSKFASNQHNKKRKLVSGNSDSVQSSDLQAAADYEMITHEKPIGRFNKFMDFSIPLSVIKLDLYFNINLKVIGVGHHMQNFVLRCVDGTLPHLNTLKVSPVHISSNISQQLLLQMDQYTVDVSIFDEHVATARALVPGESISLINLHCYTPYGLHTPELILHGGYKYGRGIKKLEPDSKAGETLRKRVDEIPIELPEPERYVVPEDEPRSLQTSPTECLHPELDLMTLQQILENPQDKTVYKTRLYLHTHLPDSYSSMIIHICSNCSTKVKQQSPLCPQCNDSSFRKELYFRLKVGDSTVESTHDVLCFGLHAKEFLGVWRLETSGQLGVLEKVVGKWCDVHVLCNVVSGVPKFHLVYTIVKS